VNTLEKYFPLLFLIMWSSGAIAVKIGLEYSSVSVFLAIRAVGAALALLAAYIFLSKKNIIPKSIILPRELLLRALAIGLVLQVGYQTAFFLALFYNLTPGVLAMLLGVQPILTPLLARERLELKSYLYLTLGFTGLIIAVCGAREIGAITFQGLFFGMISVLAISIGSVMQKKSTINPIVSAFYQSLMAAVFFLLSLSFTRVHLDLTPTFIFSAAWMIFIVSTLATALLFYMLSKNSASKVSSLFYMVPVITVIFDYIIFGHILSWATVGGALLVILAVRNFNRS
jgi:drug/metabolite transporter (DMT)-like permease